MSVCEICGKKIPSNIIIDGKRRNTHGRKYCYECIPLGQIKKGKIGTLGKEGLQRLLDESNSYKEFFSNIGLSDCCNNYVTLNKYIKEYNIDTSKIDNNRNGYLKESKIKYNNIEKDELKKKLENGEINIKASKLLNLMVDKNIKEYRCEICGIDKWMDKPIKLELHHKDGNRNNNKLDNLQILCLNCHSQTETFRAKNIS